MYINTYRRPKKFETFYKETKKYYDEYYPDESDILTEKRFNKILMDDLIETTHANCNTNDTRAGNGFESTKYLVFAVIPFVIAFFIYIKYDLDLKHPSKPILIEEKTLKGIFKNESTSKISATTSSSSGDSQCKELCHTSKKTTYIYNK
ncbi:hypothetical protein IHC92_11510 [Photobacterium damselae subsp. damselae]|uniref:hypothetical protein n=1 Tax=Photobacterium damselae TaxID=38293 RepID=UPI001F48369F|nr:hypothetical protein [Photobacterium damselae]UKA20866.1 hypothetical protein IHC92_11510 [Photobacterium damselae subsp. damselae]